MESQRAIDNGYQQIKKFFNAHVMPNFPVPGHIYIHTYIHPYIHTYIHTYMACMDDIFPVTSGYSSSPCQSIIIFQLEFSSNAPKMEALVLDARTEYNLERLNGSTDYEWRVRADTNGGVNPGNFSVFVTSRTVAGGTYSIYLCMYVPRFLPRHLKDAMPPVLSAPLLLYFPPYRYAFFLYRYAFFLNRYALM